MLCALYDIKNFIVILVICFCAIISTRYFTSRERFEEIIILFSRSLQIVFFFKTKAIVTAFMRKTGRASMIGILDNRLANW